MDRIEAEQVLKDRALKVLGKVEEDHEEYRGIINQTDRLYDEIKAQLPENLRPMVLDYDDFMLKGIELIGVELYKAGLRDMEQIHRDDARKLGEVSDRLASMEDANRYNLTILNDLLNEFDSNNTDDFKWKYGKGRIITYMTMMVNHGHQLKESIMEVDNILG